MSELTVTPELLNQIERLAKAVEQTKHSDSAKKWTAVDNHMDRMDPATTLRLVTRIRELEAENARGREYMAATASDMAGLRDVLLSEAPEGLFVKTAASLDETLSALESASRGLDISAGYQAEITKARCAASDARRKALEEAACLVATTPIFRDDLTVRDCGKRDERIIAAILAALPHLGEPYGYLFEEWYDGQPGNGPTFSRTPPIENYAIEVRNVRALFLAPPVPALPEGWRYAPLSPSIDMAEAGATAARAGEGRVPDGADKWRASATYRAMLAAAPEPPAPATDTDDGCAEIGREIVSIIGREVNDPDSPLHDWAPAETYGEVIPDLIDIIDEAKAVADADPVRAQLVEALKVAQYYFGRQETGQGIKNVIDAALAAAEEVR